MAGRIPEFAGTQSRTRTRTLTLTHTHARARTHAPTHAPTHARTHTHTHTYTYRAQPIHHASVSLTTLPVLDEKSFLADTHAVYTSRMLRCTPSSGQTDAADNAVRGGSNCRKKIPI